MTALPTTDLFLLQHAPRPGFLDLGGKVSPGSIRDQVLRAILAVDDLLRFGALKKEQCLLIVGGGVAGVVAAVRAEAADVNVFLVDKSPTPLNLLRQSDTRTVSPTLFDWPSRHWADLTYDGIFLYPESSPSKVASGLLQRFDKTLSRQGSRLQWFNQIEYLGCQPSPGGGPPWIAKFASVAQDLEVPAALNDRLFDVVMLCNGVGGESEEGLNWVGNAVPFPFFRFWEDDPYPGRGGAQVGLAAPKPQEHGDSAQVAIIGAGDGGLQDLFRFLTNGLTARDLLKAVFNAVPISSDEFRTLYQVFDQEEYFRRHEMFWPDRDRLLFQWNRSCIDAVAEFYHRDQNRRFSIRTALEKIVPFKDVLIFHSHPFIGRCYAVNRFLGLLLEQYLEETGPYGSPFRFSYKALTVECGDDHENGHSVDPLHHYRGQHQVAFSTIGGLRKSVNCRAVVVRTGPNIGGPYRRHILPYWLPDWGPPSRGTTANIARPVKSLVGDRACQSLVWKQLIGTAVLKDSEGRVFAYNPRFAWIIGDRKPADIIGYRPSEYWGGLLGEQMESSDRRSREEGLCLLTFGQVQRGDETIGHYTFRFPVQMGDGASVGSATLGFHIFGDQVVPVSSGPDPDHSPTVGEIDRFFENLPCSVAVYDREHRHIYTNRAFRKVLSPPGRQLASEDLHGRTVQEVLVNVGAARGTEDSGNEHQNRIWTKGKTEPYAHSWISSPPFGREKRFVTGFGLRDDDGRMIALATFGFRHAAIETIQKADQGCEIYSDEA
jgi:PAS domain-containing protein